MATNEYERECPSCKQMKDWAWEDFRDCEECDPSGSSAYTTLHTDTE